MNGDRRKNDTKYKNYRDFRNLVVNELGITKNDIQAWTQDSVESQLKDIMLSDDLKHHIDKCIDDAIIRCITGKDSMDIKQKLANIIAKQITLVISSDV